MKIPKGMDFSSFAPMSFYRDAAWKAGACEGTLAVLERYPTVERLVRAKTRYQLVQWICWYVKNVRHCRWSEVEPLLLSRNTVHAALLYAEICGIQEWPELQLLCRFDSLAAAEYAARFLHRRWPEMEPVILRSTLGIGTYMTHVLRGPWPEALVQCEAWDAQTGTSCYSQRYHDILRRILERKNREMTGDLAT